MFARTQRSALLRCGCAGSAALHCNRPTCQQAARKCLYAARLLSAALCAFVAVLKNYFGLFILLRRFSVLLVSNSFQDTSVPFRAGALSAGGRVGPFMSAKKQPV